MHEGNKSWWLEPLAEARGEADLSGAEAKARLARFTVHVDDGSYQTLLRSTNSGFRVGDMVRFNNGVLERY